MIHLDQGFEADFQISLMVPGLVKQGNHQVPGWETSFVLSLVQALHRLQSLGRSTPRLVRRSILQTKPAYRDVESHHWLIPGSHGWAFFFFRQVLLTFF